MLAIWNLSTKKTWIWKNKSKSSQHAGHLGCTSQHAFIISQHCKQSLTYILADFLQCLIEANKSPGPANGSFCCFWRRFAYSHTHCKRNINVFGSRSVGFLPFSKYSVTIFLWYGGTFVLIGSLAAGPTPIACRNFFCAEGKSSWNPPHVLPSYLVQHNIETTPNDIPWQPACWPPNWHYCNSNQC